MSDSIKRLRELHEKATRPPADYLHVHSDDDMSHFDGTCEAWEAECQQDLARADLWAALPALLDVVEAAERYLTAAELGYALDFTRSPEAVEQAKREAACWNGLVDALAKLEAP